jgi:hypothetical protein
MSTSRATAIAIAVVAVAVLSSCGGTAGGPGPLGAGQGLVLISASVAGVDNIVLNEIVRLEFSEPVDAETIRLSDLPHTPGNEEGTGTGAIQIRKGPQFGAEAAGLFEVDGAVVVFRPTLPGTCALGDGGFQPGTEYRVSVLGWPEELAVLNTTGQPLRETISFQFSTRPDTQPLFSDQIPGAPPAVTSWSSVASGERVDVLPGDAPAAVPVRDGNRVELICSENIDPCTVNKNSVFFRMFEVGDQTTFLTAPSGRRTGFDSVTDASPSPFSWGASNSTNTWTPPDQTSATVIPFEVFVEQDFDVTKIVVEPTSGRFPDNALLVVSVTFAIRDFGGQPLPAANYTFTTENLPVQTGSRTLEFNGDVIPDPGASTADVNTTRSPGKAQGWMLFAGDGNNGPNLLAPSGPAPCFDQADDPAGKTPFDSGGGGNVTLNTGATRNTCANETDGSTAVVFTYSSFRIRNGDVVRLTGVNPAIILVQGDVVIESGGVLRVRADEQGGAPRGDGRDPPGGTNLSGHYSQPELQGGVGMAGGGKGGNTPALTGVRFAKAGWAGYGSPDYGTPDEEGGVGGGEEGTGNNDYTTYPATGSAQGGGGGGHADVGADCLGTPGNVVWTHTDLGDGGAVYGDDRMPTPEAGSGGGGAGPGYFYVYSAGYYIYSVQGASGGAGGGFVDLSSQGNMFIFGEIDAKGSRGGNGVTTQTIIGTTGGGGGGSGGGIRLLCAGSMDISNGTISAAGGAGGSAPTASAYVPSVGGNGGPGRLILEDSDSVIQGQLLASLTPNEGAPGFHRGTFDGARFASGARTAQAVTLPFDLGPLRTVILDPEPADFLVTVPAGAGRPTPGTAMLVEAQGFLRQTDGSVDAGSATGWFTLGHFRHSGQPTPTWHANQNPPGGDVPPVMNAGIGAAGNLDGSAFLQVRVTFYLPDDPNFGIASPGPLMDRWVVNFSYDQ